MTRFNINYLNTENGYVPVNVNIPDSTTFRNPMTISINASPSPNNEINYEGTYKILMTSIGTYEENGITQSIELGTYSQEFTLNPYEEPFIGISPGKTDNSIYFRVSINDESKLVVNGLYEVKLMNSNGEVIASKSNLSINSLNRKFEYKKEDYSEIQNGQKYTFVVTAYVDYYNKKISNYYEVLTKSREITYGGDVYLGTVMLQNYTDDNGTQLNLIFSDSYNLSYITQIKYTISSINSGFYYSPQPISFFARYEPSTDLYYYTINIDDENYLSDTVYVLTASFYKGESLVDTVELDYYEGGSS